MIEIITLANGSTVSWDEFSRWSLTKQKSNIANPRMRSLQTPLGVFTSLASAIKAHDISAYVLRKKLKSDDHPDYFYLDDKTISIKNRVWDTKDGKNPMARRVMTPLGPFNSLKEAASALEISLDALNNRCRSKYHDHYYYLESKVNRVSRKNPGASGSSSGVARRIMTPIGEFETVRAAHKALGVNVTTIYNRMKNKEKFPGYYYL